MQHKILKTVIVFLGLIAFFSGGAGVFLGPEYMPNGVSPDASLDSQYRFANVFWLAAAPALWWSVRDLYNRRHVTRVVLFIAIVGGFARLLSVFITGWPFIAFTAAMILELVGVPLIIWWHYKIVGK